MILLFSESVRGMQTVKGFAAEPYQVRRFEEANDDGFSRNNGEFFGTSRFLRRSTQMLSQLSLVILFAYGGWLYVRGEIALGSGWLCSRDCFSNSPGRWPHHDDRQFGAAKPGGGPARV